MSIRPLTDAEDKISRQRSLTSSARHIPKSLLADEAKLLMRKWPGYCFVSPWDANWLYADAYRRQFLSCFGISTAFKIEPGQPAFTKLCEMRQGADWWGLPYDDLLAIAFSMNRRNPDPFLIPHDRFSRLFANRNFTKKFRKQRPELRLKYFYDEVGPQFHVAAFEGLPSQVAFRNSVISTAKETRNWAALVRGRVVGQHCIPDAMLEGFDIARARDDVRGELEAGGLEVKPFPGIEAHQLWQSCFAVPGARDPSSSPCSTCPVSYRCLEAGMIVARAAAVAV